LTNNGYFEKIDLKLFIEKEISILSPVESDKILKEFHESNNILKITYQLLSEESEEEHQKVEEKKELEKKDDKVVDNKMEIDSESLTLEKKIIETAKVPSPQQRINFNSLKRTGYGSYLNKMKPKKILPISYTPENINIDDYNLEIRDDKLINVVNKETNHKMLLEGIKFVEEVVKNDVPAKIKVYSQIVNSSTINVLHFHLKDNSIDSNTIISNGVILNKIQSAKEYKKAIQTKITDDISKTQMIYKDFKVIVFY